MPKLVDVAEVKPEEPTVKVYEPALVRTRFVNVAVPAIAATVVVLPAVKPPGPFAAMVTLAVLLVRLPLGSSIWTVIVPSKVPATAVAGCAEYTSWLGSATRMVKVEDVDGARPAELAVKE